MDMLVKWEAKDTKGATLTTGIDTIRKVVRITPGGSWTASDVKKFEQLQKLINDTARSRYGTLKIVMDLREAQVLTADVSDRMHASSRDIYRASDYIAVVATSTLLKLQLRRSFRTGIVNIFTSEHEAEAWLAQPVPSEAVA